MLTLSRGSADTSQLHLPKVNDDLHLPALTTIYKKFHAATAASYLYSRTELSELLPPVWPLISLLCKGHFTKLCTSFMKEDPGATRKKVITSQGKSASNWQGSTPVTLVLHQPRQASPDYSKLSGKRGWNLVQCHPDPARSHLQDLHKCSIWHPPTQQEHIVVGEIALTSISALQQLRSKRYPTSSTVAVKH